MRAVVWILALVSVAACAGADAPPRPGEPIWKLQASALPPLPAPPLPLVPLTITPAVPEPRPPPPVATASALGRGVRRFFGHHDAVSTLDVDPQGKVLATGSQDHTLRLWHLDDGQPFARLERRGGNVERVRFSPTGDVLFSVSKAVGSGVAAWDPSGTSEVPRRALALGGGYDEDLALHPSGTLFATGGYKKVYVVRLPDYAVAAELPAQGSTTRVAFTPDGKRLLVGNSDGQVALWDTADWSHTHTVALPKVRGYDGGRVQGLDPTPDSARAYVLSAKQWAVLELATGTWVGEPRPEWQGQASALRPGGRVLALSDYSHEVRLVDPLAGRPLGVLRGHRDGVNALRWLPDGRLVSGSDDGTVVLWEVSPDAALTAGGVGPAALRVATFDPATTMPNPGPEAPRFPESRLIGDIPHESIAGLAAAFSPDGHLFAGGYSGKLRLYRTGEDAHFLELSRTVTRGYAHAFTPDSSRIVYLDKDRVRVARLPDGVELAAFQTPGGGWPHNVLVSPDGTRYLLTHGHGTVTLHALDTGVELRRLEVQDDQPGATETRLYGVAFSPDGRQALVGGTDRVARVLDLEAGKVRLELRGHEHTIWRTGFLPDGRMVTTSLDKTVRWWAADGTPGPVGRGHSEGVRGLAVLPDLVLTGGRDGAVLFWDATTGRKRLRFDTAAAEIDFLAVSPGGGWLVTSGDNSGQRSYPLAGLRPLMAGN